MSDQPDALTMPVSRAADPAGVPLPSRPQRRAFPWAATGIRLFILLLVGGLIVFLAHEWDWWVGSAVWQSTDDAYLQADTTPLAAKVPGYVRQVVAQDFQQVKAGDVLVQMVDDDYRAQLDQAQANVMGAEAAIAIIEQQKRLQDALIKQAQAMIAATQADLTRYHLETVRQQALLATRIAGTAPTHRAGRRQRATCRGDTRAEPCAAGPATPAVECVGQPGGAGSRDTEGAAGDVRPGGNQSRLHAHHCAG